MSGVKISRVKISGGKTSRGNLSYNPYLVLMCTELLHISFKTVYFSVICIIQDGHRHNIRKCIDMQSDNIYAYKIICFLSNSLYSFYFHPL